MLKKILKSKFIFDNFIPFVQEKTIEKELNQIQTAVNENFYKYDTVQVMDWRPLALLPLTQ